MGWFGQRSRMLRQPRITITRIVDYDPDGDEIGLVFSGGRHTATISKAYLSSLREFERLLARMFPKGEAAVLLPTTERAFKRWKWEMMRRPAKVEEEAEGEESTQVVEA